MLLVVMGTTISTVKVVLPACSRGRCGDGVTTRHTQIFLIQASTQPLSRFLAAFFIALMVCIKLRVEGPC